jgi:hypothetical protein
MWHSPTGPGFWMLESVSRSSSRNALARRLARKMPERLLISLGVHQRVTRPTVEGSGASTVCGTTR